MLRRGQPLWWLVAAAAIAVALAPQAFVQHTDCASCVAAGFGWSLKKAKCGMFANHECGDSPPPPPPPPPPVDDDAAVISATFAQEGPLGLKFGKRASTAPEGWDVVSIATVQSDTQATQHPALVPGLILHSINGVAITGLRYAEAIQLLKATPRPTTLTFRPGPPPPPPPPPRRKKPSSSPAPAPGSTRDVGVVLSTAGLTFAEQRAQALAQHAKTGACGGMDCYRATLARDLVPWSADGISREVFEKTRTYNINAGRMNHYQIIGGRLYRSGRCPSRSGRLTFHPRCEGIEHTLLEILAEDKAWFGKASGPSIPDVEFVVNVNDKPQMAHGTPAVAGSASKCINHNDGKKLCTDIPLPLFSFSKPQGVDASQGVRGTEPVGGPFWDIMYPAWTFWGGGPFISVEPNHGLGRWDKKRDAMIEAGNAVSWEQKTAKAFFRGSRTTPQRDPLVKLTTTRPDLAHAHYTKNQATRDLGDTLGLAPAEEMPLEGHCDYRYLFNFKGMAASFRFKHLFLCRSLVFHVGTPGDDFIEFFQEALEPWVHYVPVAEDLSDLEATILWAKEHDEEARAIAEAGYEFILENLTYEHVKDYWRELLSEYAKLLRFDIRKHPDTSEITARMHKVVDHDGL